MRNGRFSVREADGRVFLRLGPPCFGCFHEGTHDSWLATDGSVSRQAPRCSGEKSGWCVGSLTRRTVGAHRGRLGECQACRTRQRRVPRRAPHADAAARVRHDVAGRTREGRGDIPRASPDAAHRQYPLSRGRYLPDLAPLRGYSTGRRGWVSRGGRWSAAPRSGAPQAACSDSRASSAGRAIPCAAARSRSPGAPRARGCAARSGRS